MKNITILCLFIGIFVLPACQNSQSNLEKGNQFFVLANYQKAIDAYTLVLAKDSNDFGALLNRGIAFLRRSDGNSAFGDLSRAYHIDSLNPQANFYLAYYYDGIMYSPGFDKVIYALPRYNRAIQLDSTEANFFLQRGLFLFLEFDVDSFSGAMRDYNKAICIDSCFVEAFRARSDLRYKMGDTIGGDRDLKKCAELGDEFAKAIVHLNSMNYGVD